MHTESTQSLDWVCFILFSSFISHQIEVLQWFSLFCGTCSRDVLSYRINHISYLLSLRPTHSTLCHFYCWDAGRHDGDSECVIAHLNRCLRVNLTMKTMRNLCMSPVNTSNPKHTDKMDKLLPASPMTDECLKQMQTIWHLFRECRALVVTLSHFYLFAIHMHCVRAHGKPTIKLGMKFNTLAIIEYEMHGGKCEQ